MSQLRRIAQINATYLLVVCVCLAASPYEPPSPNQEPGALLELAEEQLDYSSLAGRKPESLKKYLIRDVDYDGFTTRQPLEQWKLIRLNQLLDALSSSIPSPAPIYRSGRTYPSALGSERRASAPAAEPALPVEPAGQRGPAKQRAKAPLLGIVWPQTRAMSQAYANARKFQANATSKGSSPAAHRRLGSEEYAIHTPMHSSSSSDYEWKRVENSRWNNLRGMWGKRSDSALERKWPEPELEPASDRPAGEPLSGLVW